MYCKYLGLVYLYQATNCMIPCFPAERLMPGMLLKANRKNCGKMTLVNVYLNIPTILFHVICDVTGWMLDRLIEVAYS